MLRLRRIMEILYGAKEPCWLLLTRSAITPPKVNRFGWNLEQCEPNVGGWHTMRPTVFCWFLKLFFMIFQRGGLLLNISFQCTVGMLTRPGEDEAKAKLLTHTSKRLFQHQHYASRDIMTVQTSSLRNTGFSSILSLILALFGSIISPLSLHWCRGLEIRLYEADVMTSIRPRPP